MASIAFSALHNCGERKTSSIDVVQKLDYEILNAVDKIQFYKRKRQMVKLSEADVEELKKLKALIEHKLHQKRDLGW